MKVVAFRGLPDHVRSEVEHGLDVDVFVSRFHDAFDAPLHVLSVELELGFGDVVVVLPCGLGLVGQLNFVPAFIYLSPRKSLVHLAPYIVDFRSHCGHQSYMLQILPRAARQTFRVVRVYFHMAPSQDGERAEPLAKMLLGAKHAGRPRIVSRIIVKKYCAL